MRYTVLLVLRYALIPQAVQLGVLLAVSCLLEIARSRLCNDRAAAYRPGKLARSATLAYLAYLVFAVLVIGDEVDWSVSPPLDVILSISRNGKLWSALSIASDVALGVTALGWWRSSRLTLKDAGFRGPQRIERTAATLSVVLLVICLVAGAMLHDPSLKGGPARESVATVDRPDVLLWAWTVLIVPLTEEVFFRGMLQNELKKLVPTALAVTLQAIAFGLMHVVGGPRMALLILAGLLQGCIYEATGTIYAAWLVHSLWNATVIAMALTRTQPPL